MNRIVAQAERAGLAGDLAVEPFKEVVRIQLGLARASNRWRQIGRQFTLRSANFSMVSGGTDNLARVTGRFLMYSSPPSLSVTRVSKNNIVTG